MHILRLYEILIGDHLTPAEMRDDHGFVDDMLNGNRRVIDKTRAQCGYRDSRVIGDLVQVVLDYFTAILVGWWSNVNHTVEAARTQERRIKRIGDIGCTHGKNRLILHATMIETKQTED